MDLDSFNRLGKQEARNCLSQCCAAQTWINGVVDHRPYRDWQAFSDTVDLQWRQTQEPDWLEAFAAHPQIGNVSTLRAKYASTKILAAGEQGLVSEADEQTLVALAAGNQDYLSKFGFIFIVCATGKSAAQMLELLNQRLPNDRDTELRIAAAEQHKITLLRLGKIFNPDH